VAVLNKGRILAMGSLKELTRKLWPVTWVDITFWQAPAENVTGGLKARRGVMQVTGQGEALQVQVENEEVIPQVVQHLAGQGASILKVNPRDYTLEDIYFALQAGEK
jgi:ABC-2 type transport system ATP-binding protein